MWKTDTAHKTEEGMHRHAPWLKAGVIAHATGVAREDFAGLTKDGKLGVVAVREDPLFSDEVRDYGTKVAKEKGSRVQERVFEHVPHGESYTFSFLLSCIKPGEHCTLPPRSHPGFFNVG